MSVSMKIIFVMKLTMTEDVSNSRVGGYVILYLI